MTPLVCTQEPEDLATGMEGTLSCPKRLQLRPLLLTALTPLASGPDLGPQGP